MEALGRPVPPRQQSSGRLLLVPKLKYEHVYLTSFSKIRVDLAGTQAEVRACLPYVLQQDKG